MHPDGCPCGQCPGLRGFQVGGFDFEWPAVWKLADLSALGLVVLAGITIYKEFWAKKR